MLRQHRAASGTKSTGFAVAAAVAAAGALALGRMTTSAPNVAMLLALAPAYLALAIANAGLIAAATLPATFFTFRVGPAALDMSVADFALLCAIPVGVTSFSRLNRSAASIVRVVAAYQVMILIVVAAHPTPHAITEWVHRLGLMGGSVIVGAAIVRLGALRVAIGGFLTTAGVFAAAAMLEAARTGFAPAYPLGIHKNAAGSLLAMAIAMVATLPESAGLPARWNRHLYALYGAGLFATRSRGAIVGVGAVLVLLVLSRRSSTRLRAITLVGALVGAVFVWNSVQEERRTDIFNHGAISVRERQQEQAWAAFEDNRVTGAGIRYYDSEPRLALDGRPSSTIYEALAESGVIGLAGLALVVGGPLLILRRNGSAWAIVAMAVYGTKAGHSVFDNFWVAGPFTLPWLVMGIGAAIDKDDEASHDDGPPEPAPTSRRRLAALR